jgi:NDP-sugar pyrophosphorylase family protein
MMAVVLAGGQGARLRPFTVTVPKPLLPLGDVPILEIVLRQLAAAGFDRVVLALGHMAPLITAFFDDVQLDGLELEYFVESEPLGTAGAVGLISELEDDFVVMVGDVLTDLDFNQVLRFHRSSGAWGTIAVTRREIEIDFGVITREGHLLEEYSEKPTMTLEMSMGVNVLSRRCLEFIPRGGRIDMPDLMMAMKSAGKKVVCFPSDCYWQDIGRFDDYERATVDFAADPRRFLPPPDGEP